MTEAKSGDTVRIHYTGRLSDGTEFDSSAGREPLEFTLGAGQVVPGFEKAVIGMSLGETKTAEIPPEEAYGPIRQEHIIEADRSEMPDGLDPQMGKKLQMSQPDGRSVAVEITNVTESKVTLDANHPLAGKTLVFDLELVEIR